MRRSRSSWPTVNGSAGGVRFATSCSHSHHNDGLSSTGVRRNQWDNRGVDEPLIDGPREPDAGEIEGAAWGDRAVRGVLEVTERSWPVVMVFVACAAILFWRALSWAPSERGDAWEYTAWGQALSRGERPVYGHAMTTPKPLGFAVGLLVSPM